MSLERGTLPEKSVTAGMSDKEFDRWVEQLGGRPCDEEFCRRQAQRAFALREIVEPNFGCE